MRSISLVAKFLDPRRVVQFFPLVQGHRRGSKYYTTLTKIDHVQGANIGIRQQIITAR